ncbi:MAG: hypothetical protein Q8M51_03280 [Polaromonas sp.]|nr:hypothetical protein [Polaromonas sp.]
MRVYQFRHPGTASSVPLQNRFSEPNSKKLPRDASRETLDTALQKASTARCHAAPFWTLQAPKDPTNSGAVFAPFPEFLNPR